MELISLKFVLFLAGLLTTYYVVGRIAQRFQWVVLLIGSMAFYCLAGSWTALVFMLSVAAITWGASLWLNNIERQAKDARKQAKGRDAKKAVKQAYAKKKRVAFLVALALGLSFLVYFKYWNAILFYTGLVDTIYGLGILLPLGISFYTFQALAYLIDSYNGKYPPEKNFARYLLFISYFPQIIEGPINRFDALKGQLFAPHDPRGTHMERGLLRMGYGILKKVGIANILSNAVHVTFDVALGPNMPGSLVIYGLITYSIQMYADFSGGIDIVEGTSELFGIEMAQNFRQPYFSTSLAEFWRRWHMSLGTWMRDYVFYPLAVTSPSRKFGKWAGKRFGKHAGRTLPACVANVIVFLLVGLWHGAEIHLLVWGLYNGVVVALSDLCAPLFDKAVERLRLDRSSFGYRLFGIARTFIVVCIGRAFDRIGRMGDVFYALRNMFCGINYLPTDQALGAYGALYPSDLGFPVPAILACLVVLAVDVWYESGTDVRGAVLGWRLPARVAWYVAIALIIGAAVAYDTTSGGGGFLYANF